MSLRSWGNYPKTENNVTFLDESEKIKRFVLDTEETIPYGNGRSYGDSALTSHILSVKPRKYFLNFDENRGVLHVQAGALLSEILETFVPRGWFLKISPGTKLITVGGAIASDIHGKNHHMEGCFSECVLWFNLLLPDGNIVKCSKNENVELYRASCGGMGLTGVILDAEITLKRITSKYIDQTTIKTRNIKETFEAFEDYKDYPYSVAWIDCLAKGKNLGRCLLMVGDFKADGDLDYQNKRKLNIPFHFPSFALNKLSVKIFNTIYYNKVRKKISKQKVDIDTFFYPLDALGNWNRIYGKKGFTQYQFILPKEHSLKGLEEILETIASSGKGSFLAVLKLYGKNNDNYLSFPLEGYSLALDFKIEKGLFDLLDKIDEIVLKYEGRIYLAKDVRVSREVFEKGYPMIGDFRRLRKHYKMDQKFNSIQSKRLAL